MVIACIVFFVFSDWDGIMERDSQQGEAEGVTICDPSSESNPPGKIFKTILNLSSLVHIFVIHFII